jgi:curved DNA-binding protein
MRYQDYYATLGVERTAGADEIKKAYRRLARRYHPDVSKEKDAEARFKEVNEAYSVLSDTEKRAAYDQLGAGYNAGDEFRPPPDWAAGFGGGGAGATDFGDLFESLFRQHAGGATRTGRRSPRRAPDQSVAVEVSLEESALGTQRTVRIAGTDGVERTLKVTIPAGVVEGSKVRLAGQATAGPGQTPGDLFLEVQVRPHPLFRVSGRDLNLELPLAVWEAALGARIEVPTLTGRVELNIPAGTQGGQRLRLKGRGLPGTPAGDLLVSIQLRAPPAAQANTLPGLYARLRDESGFDARADWPGR